VVSIMSLAIAMVSIFYTIVNHTAKDLNSNVSNVKIIKVMFMNVRDVKIAIAKDVVLNK